MKHYNILTVCFLALFSFLTIVSHSQTMKEPEIQWKREINSLKVFIENNGQFNKENVKDLNVLYGYVGGSEKFFFTENGFIIKIDNIIKKRSPAIFFKEVLTDEKIEKFERYKVETSYLYVTWKNAAEHPNIVTSGTSEGYYTFGMETSISKGFKKITYQNIYPGINVEFTIPEDKTGIKYSFIVQPGADISKISIQYNGDVKGMLKDVDGNIVINTPAWNITEHAPISFQNNKQITSAYNLNDNNISFQFPEGYDSHQPLIIDPWISGIVISASDIAYDVDYDYSSNLYTFIRPQGNTSIYINKYSSTGTLLWSHLSPYDFSLYEGNFIVEKNTERVYIGEGFNASGARLYRLAANGVADGFASSQNSNYLEIWDIGFDCNGNNSIIVVGGGTSSNLTGGKVNTATGALTISNFTGVAGTCQDIVSYSLDNQSNLFVVYARSSDGVSSAINDKISLVNAALNGYIWMVPHGMFGFDEVSNHWPTLSIFASTSNGFNALCANDNYLYYYDGGGLAAYNKANGAQLSSSSVGLSGIWHTPLVQGGIGVDDCENVYLGGSSNNILTYNFNGSSFTQTGSTPLGWSNGGQVFDIKYDRNTNQLFVCGNQNVGVYYAPQSASCNLMSSTTTCIGPNNGSSTVTVNTPSVTPLVTYVWTDIGGTTISQTPNSNSLTNTVTGLSNGSYIVRAQLNPPCGPVFIDTVDVLCPSCFTTLTMTPVSCMGGNNGTATATPNGGLGPFTYVWSPAPGTGQGTATIGGLTAQTYYVTVTDENLCTSTANIAIAQPTALVSVISNVTDVSCFGGSDGSVTVSPSGGTSPYTQVWTDNQTTTTASGLGFGTYFVTVTDANLCTAVQSAIVSQPPALSITATASPTAICPGASSTLTANNASTYLWSPAATLSASTGTSVTASPLSNTTYYVTGTDALGCTATTQVDVSVHNSPVINISGNSICSGGTAQLIASGGTSYVWNTGPVTAMINVMPLATTTYTVTGTDANTCTSSAQYSVTVTTTPIANAGPDQQECSLSTTLQAVPTVGTGTWTLTGTGNVTFSDLHSATSGISSLSSGIYTLVWTEDNGNSCFDSDTVIVQLTNPPTSDFTLTPINCNGEATLITYTGNCNSNCTFTWNFDGGVAVPGTGSGPHNVTWAATGTHPITLTVSLNGCSSAPTTQNILHPTQLTSLITNTNIQCYGQTNGTVDLTISGGTIPYGVLWNNSLTTEDLNGIGAGNYTATITDASGCTITNGVNVTEPQQLIITTSPDVTICRGETTFLTITATGGTNPYQYFWNGVLSNPVQGVLLYSDSTFNALVIDSYGCTSNVSDVTISVGPPLVLTLIKNTDYICPGNPVVLTVSITGGFGPPYMLINQDGMVFSPPIIIYPEETMTYTVTGQDICGTRDTGQVIIHVLPEPPLNFIADTINGCAPFTVSFLETSPNQGQIYLWDFGDNSNISQAKNPVHIFNQAGTYNVTLTVTSIQGCVSTETKPSFINVYPQPHSLFTWNPEFTSILKPIFQFTSISQNAAQHFWFFGDGDSSSVIHPYHRYPHAGTYLITLVTVSNQGCTDTAQANVVVKDDFTLYAPTAFSPDFNNINDVWFVTGHNISEEGFHIAIYDRWGQIIWETDKYNSSNPEQYGWDGRNKSGEIVKIDTYIWMATCNDWKGNKKEFTGNVTIIK